MNEETYLGDGVYAHFDGWHIWLWTMNSDGTSKQRIALDPAAYNALTQYADKVWPKQEDSK